MMTLVVAGDAGAIAALCRAPLAPTALPGEEQHAAGGSAASESFARWTTEDVDARSSDQRERDGHCIVGYFDRCAMARAADPVQARPLRRRRADIVQQGHR